MFMSPAQQTRTVPSLSIPGRQHEIGRLQAAWELCRNGRGGVVTLHGPVGVGRTELLDAFGEFADSDGAQVLRAAGSPLERDFPLGIVRQLFQSPHLAPEVVSEAARLLSARSGRRRSRSEGSVPLRPALGDGGQSASSPRRFQVRRRSASPVPLENGRTKFILLRTGESRQGVVGLFQPGLSGEQGMGLSVRFMQIDRSAIASYLISLYCSLAVLTDDALAVLDDVEVDKFHDYAPSYR